MARHLLRTVAAVGSLVGIAAAVRALLERRDGDAPAASPGAAPLGASAAASSPATAAPEGADTGQVPAAATDRVEASGPAPPATTGASASPEPRRRTGSVADRGRVQSYAVDLERLRGHGEFEPVMEYLTYIQSQRGDDSHLLFVRNDDIDRLAELEGDTADRFLERLDHLGVVISNN